MDVCADREKVPMNYDKYVGWLISDSKKQLIRYTSFYITLSLIVLIIRMTFWSWLLKFRVKMATLSEQELDNLAQKKVNGV